MPYITYADMRSIAQHLTDIQQQQAIPANINPALLIHVLLAHSDQPWIKHLFEQNPAAFIQLCGHYNTQSVLYDEDDGQEDNISDVLEWIDNTLHTHFAIYLQQNHDILSVEQLEYLIRRIDIKKLPSNIPEPNEYSSISYVRNYLAVFHGNKKIVQKVNHVIQEWPDEQRRAFLDISHEYFTLLNPRLFDKDIAHFQSKRYSLVEYRNMYPLLRFLGIQDKISFIPYKKSAIRFAKQYEELEFSRVGLYQYHTLLTQFGVSVSLQDIKDLQKCPSNLANSILETYFNGPFQTSPAEEQYQAMNYLQHHRSFVTIDSSVKNALKIAVMSSRDLRTLCSPAFEHIEQGHTVDLSKIPKYIEPYLRLWLQQHQPGLLPTLKSLNITSTRQALVQYNNTINIHAMTETDIHL